ncbi:MAG TPA: hypothetical protein PLE61_03385 [Vicinamibacterales bacterium]|nr:hypothetical protein [Vicinamibacterales bacterium]HPW19834.1 hypothetical protein [Vicinamibacterales bacterium]
MAINTRTHSLRAAWPAWLTGACLLASAVEIGGRQVIRRSVLGEATALTAPPAGAVIGFAALAAAACLFWLRRRRGATAPRAVALALAVLFVAGLAAQQRLGARLQSDGFFYFAFLRSFVFDRDVNLRNDYPLIGIGGQWADAATVTGHAHSAWSVGPAMAWSPFFAIGHAGARYLASQGVDVHVDGSSYPYRQAVCVAGLFYGLLGFWFAFRLAARHVPEGIAALSTAVMAFGSFMLWYLVKEPTMSHATSMCAVAAFVYAWAVTRGRRTLLQWAALGLLGGLMLAIRWQNLVFMLFPAWEAARAIVAGPGAAGRRRMLANGAAFAGAAFAAFLPQLLAWNAIYGSPLAVSPYSPRMLWLNPDLVGMLWSSRNGLFATSPVTYVAAVGLAWWAFRERSFGPLALAAFGLAVYVNASVEDWWGGAAFGPRRFDGTVPLLVLGLAASVEGLRGWLARRPMAAIASLLAALVLWNVTAIAAALAGRFGGSVPQSFTDLSVDQARTLSRWFGHPFSYPANLIYALREGVAPWRWDYFAFPMLADERQPYGRVDLGGQDEFYVTAGWHAPEADADGTTFRWAASTAEILLPLHHPAPVTVQLRVRPFSPPGASPALAVRVNGRAYGPFPVAPGWQRVDFPTDAEAWRAGVNRVQLVWPAAAVPARVGVGGDTRELGGSVDYLRIALPR